VTQVTLINKNNINPLERSRGPNLKNAQWVKCVKKWCEPILHMGAECARDSSVAFDGRIAGVGKYQGQSRIFVMWAISGLQLLTLHLVG
jgi:hypothetical protein